MTQQHENKITISVLDGEEPYFFSPSITKTRTLKGKSYIVRSYFAGGKDIHETVKRLAAKQAYKKAG